MSERICSYCQECLSAHPLEMLRQCKRQQDAFREAQLKALLEAAERQWLEAQLSLKADR